MKARFPIILIPYFERYRASNRFKRAQGMIVHVRHVPSGLSWAQRLMAHCSQERGFGCPDAHPPQMGFARSIPEQIEQFIPQGAKSISVRIYILHRQFHGTTENGLCHPLHVFSGELE